MVFEYGILSSPTAPDDWSMAAARVSPILFLLFSFVSSLYASASHSVAASGDLLMSVLCTMREWLSCTRPSVSPSDSFKLFVVGDFC